MVIMAINKEKNKVTSETKKLCRKANNSHTGLCPDCGGILSWWLDHECPKKWIVMETSQLVKVEGCGVEDVVERGGELIYRNTTYPGTLAAAWAENKFWDWGCPRKMFVSICEYDENLTNEWLHFEVEVRCQAKEIRQSD